jgi:hypothetical protein
MRYGGTILIPRSPQGGPSRHILCLITHHAIKTYSGVEVWLHVFLASALDRGKRSTSHAGRFNSGERGPEARLDAVVKRRNPCLCRESNPVYQSVARDFLFYIHHIQNDSGAHLASYPMGTRDSFSGGKVAGA